MERAALKQLFELEDYHTRLERSRLMTLTAVYYTVDEHEPDELLWLRAQVEGSNEYVSTDVECAA